MSERLGLKRNRHDVFKVKTLMYRCYRELFEIAWIGSPFLKTESCSFGCARQCDIRIGIQDEREVGGKGKFAIEGLS